MPQPIRKMGWEGGRACGTPTSTTRPSPGVSPVRGRALRPRSPDRPGDGAGGGGENTSLKLEATAVNSESSGP